MPSPKVRFFHKTLTLPDDVIELLKGEENQSALVADLIRSYYALNTKIAEIDHEIERRHREIAALGTRREGLIKRQHESESLETLVRPYREYFQAHKENWLLPQPLDEWIEEAARKLELDPEELERKLKHPTPFQKVAEK